MLPVFFIPEKIEPQITQILTDQDKSVLIRVICGKKPKITDSIFNNLP